MKLLILTDGIYPFVIGGMQKHSYYLAKNLAALGHEVTLVHCVDASKKPPSPDEVREALSINDANALEVISLSFPKASWFPGHYLKESYMYSQMIYDRLKSRLNEFDFIYSKGFTAWYFLNKKKGGEKMPPVSVKFHGYEMFQPPASFNARIQHWLLQSPRKVEQPPR